jgi:hypothetical protein
MAEVSAKAKQRIQDKLMAAKARYHDVAPEARDEATGWNEVAKVAEGTDQTFALSNAKRSANTANRATIRETSAANLLTIVENL